MNQNMRKEYEEVLAAARRVIVDIDGALDQLHSAKSWSTWDLFGGEFFSSWMKRRRMSGAEDYLDRLRRDLTDLSKELEDVDSQYIAQMDFSFGREFFDLFFDNFFTDYKVHREIKKGINELKQLRREITELIDVTKQVLAE